MQCGMESYLIFCIECQVAIPGHTCYFLFPDRQISVTLSFQSTLCPPSTFVVFLAPGVPQLCVLTVSLQTSSPNQGQCQG